MKKKIIFSFLILNFLSGFAQEKFEVFFDFNSEIPNEKSYLDLDNWINTHKNSRVIKLHGFCDSIDSKQYNHKLALIRIENVLKILNKQNINVLKNVVKQAIGENFNQSKIDFENRKVVIYFEEIPFSEKIKTAKKGDALKLENIQFQNGSGLFVEKSLPVLNDLLKVMLDNSKLKIEIQGHICCQKKGDLNNVSHIRAKAVYDFLLKNNIDKTRMRYAGMGISKPIFSIPEKNIDEENANRRVEILILEN